MTIVIATPTRDGHIGSLHYASAWPMMGCKDFEIIDPQLLIEEDLTHARSRAARLFLMRTIGDYLLFWDADVGDVDGKSVSACLRGMVAAQVDCIGATYPKKKLGPDGRPIECALNTDGKEIEFRGNVAKVPGIGLGFMLLSRDLLEAMTARFDDELWYQDGFDEERTVGLFHLLYGYNLRGIRRLWPEDYSFCRRVRLAGADVHLYTGEGSPLAHEGRHVYRMRAEDVHPRTATAPNGPATP